MPFVFRLFKIVYYRTCYRQSSIKVTSIKENWTTIKSNEKDIRFFFLQSLMELWQESNWFFVLILFFFYSWSWIRNWFIQAFLNGSMHYTLAEFWQHTLSISRPRLQGFLHVVISFPAHPCWLRAVDEEFNYCGRRWRKIAFLPNN